MQITINIEIETKNTSLNILNYKHQNFDIDYR